MSLSLVNTVELPPYLAWAANWGLLIYEHDDHLYKHCFNHLKLALQWQGWAVFRLRSELNKFNSISYL